jgi:hypothetical protein
VRPPLKSQRNFKFQQAGDEAVNPPGKQPVSNTAIPRGILGATIARMLICRQIVFGLAAFAAICGDSWGQSQQQPPPEAQQGQQSQSGSATKERGTELAPFVVKILPAQEAQPNANELAKRGDEKANNEGQLVTATWVLAGIGVLQFIALCIQAGLLARTIVHMRISEGAHVSGGANWIRDPEGNITHLVAAINNYGKTPATIGTVATTICDEEELNTTFPGWGVRTWQGHQFTSEWRGYVFGQVSGQQIAPVFRFEPGRVIAGRIWYRDVYKKRHCVGFLLRTDDLTAIGRKEFWEEREEKDPNE